MVNKKWILGLAAFLMMIGLLSMGVNYIVAGVMTIVVIMLFNGGKNFTQFKDRTELLQTQCDPEAFLKLTAELKSQVKNNKKMITYLQIDEAVGKMTIGDFQGAKAILQPMEEEKLPNQYHIDLIYKMNYMYCLYELGEIENAENIYLDLLPLLSVEDAHVQMTKEVLLAERAYFVGEYQEAKTLIGPLLERNLKQRTRMSLIYRLALIAEAEGDEAAAKTYFAEVADKGNRLWIADQARAYMSGEVHQNSTPIETTEDHTEIEETEEL